MFCWYTLSFFFFLKVSPWAGSWISLKSLRNCFTNLALTNSAFHGKVLFLSCIHCRGSSLILSFYNTNKCILFVNCWRLEDLESFNKSNIMIFRFIIPVRHYQFLDIFKVKRIKRFKGIRPPYMYTDHAGYKRHSDKSIFHSIYALWTLDSFIRVI